jgi:serine/threonine-protein kinase
MLRAPGSDANNPPPNTRSLQPGSVVMGRYTIQKIVGRGGMATVYLAKNQETERLVALKILDPEISSDPSYVERFRREARAAGRIRSDHVVAIYDLGTDEYGTLVLVMEYLEGQTVQQALRNGRLPLQRAAILGRQLCEGLAAAHESGVIHRDLKPANLIIERLTGGAEKLKILDFGISKLAEASSQELTRAGQTLGTLAYMAPEQIRGAVKGNDPRIDLYSAGVSLFLMFTAKRPIDADDTVQLLQAVLEKPPLTLAQAAGVEFPPAFEAFVAKCLTKDPTRRYQSALEMRDALLQAAHDSGIDAIAHFSSPNAAHSAPARQSAPPSYGTPPSGVSSTVMEPAPTFTPPSGVIVSNIEPSGPSASLTLPSFDDEEEEGKTEVRAPNGMPLQQSGPSAPLPLAGRRPTPPVGMPVAVPNAPMPSHPPLRSPTMASPAAHHPGQPTIPPGNRSGTLVGMPDAPPPPSLGGGQAALGESPPTQAVDVFGGPPPANPGVPQFQFDGPSGAMPVHNNALTMPPPTGYAPEEPPKRSSMKFVLLAACAASALILSVAGYVAVSGRRPQAAAAQASIRAPRPSTPAPVAAPPAAPTPAPVAQPLAPAPVAQALAPTPTPAEAPQAQVLAVAPTQPPPEATPPAADPEPAQAANEPDARRPRRGRRAPAAEAPAAPPAPRAVAAARPARPAAAPTAAPARPARPPRVRRGPITDIPF